MIRFCIRLGTERSRIEAELRKGDELGLQIFIPLLRRDALFVASLPIRGYVMVHLVGGR